MTFVSEELLYIKLCSGLLHTMCTTVQTVYIHIDPNALTQLPQDGNLANLTSIIVESPADSDQRDVTPDTCDPYDSHLAQSFTYCCSVKDRARGCPALSPPAAVYFTYTWSLHNTHVAFHRRNALNEFTTEGYFSCASRPNTLINNDYYPTRSLPLAHNAQHSLYSNLLSYKPN